MDSQNFYPTYPGFSKIFGNDLEILKNSIEEITDDEIANCTDQINYNKTIQQFANLIYIKMKNITVRDPRPDVVIISTPEKIIEYCDINGEDLFEKSDLRCIIKCNAMMLGMSTQLMLPGTLRERKVDSPLQHESIRAWNFSTAIYYKSEGYPWKITEMPIGTCYIGISFYKMKTSENKSVGSSLAQIFTHTGHGLVLQGSTTIRDPKSREVHLTEEGSYKIISDAINLYKDQMKNEPSRLVVHKTSKYSVDELKGFNQASENIKIKDFINIGTRGIRFVRSEGTNPPLRGTCVTIGQNKHLLFTRGYIPFYDMYPGLRVPTPLEVTIYQQSSKTDDILKEILALSKMNWNSADMCIREPVTIAYARNVGKILAYIPEEGYARPEYYYYM